MIERQSHYDCCSQWTLIPCQKNKASLFIALHGFRQNRHDSIKFWSTLIPFTHFLAPNAPLVHEYAKPRKIGRA